MNAVVQQLASQIGLFDNRAIHKDDRRDRRDGVGHYRSKR